MKRVVGLVVLLFSSLMFAFAATIGVIIAFPERNKMAAAYACALAAIGIASLVWAAFLVRWPRRLFAAVAGILIVATSAVAVYAGSRNQGIKQKRTIASIRAVAVAAESHKTDQKKYPVSSDLLREVPRRDAWGHKLRYELIEVGDGSQYYFVASPGKDGLWQRPQLTEYPSGATTSFDEDIIFSNGQFLQGPR